MEAGKFSKIELQIWQMAMPYLSVMENTIHTSEVVKFSSILLQSVAGDRGVVMPTAILHDVGWSQLSDEVQTKARLPKSDIELIRLHEKAGVIIAREILDAVGYDRTKTKEILMIIDGHDTQKSPLTINDKIIRDADKLSRYSGYFWKNYARFRDQVNMDLNENFSRLESRIAQWFYFSESKEIAYKELKRRKLEINNKKNEFPMSTP
jgi:HD superfamily phosphohydrolase YqeK